jgi:hypothetical protein
MQIRSISKALAAALVTAAFAVGATTVEARVQTGLGYYPPQLQNAPPYSGGQHRTLGSHR